MKNYVLSSDHNAYLIEPAKAEEALASWKKLGLESVNTVETQLFPAAHHFLSAKGADGPVVSLIVPKAEDLFFDEVLNHSGSSSFYSAYAISPDLSIDTIHDQMKAWGWQLMGGVFTWEDSKGPQQHAIAVAPAKPFGPFTIFVQRRSAPSDEGRSEIDLLILDEIFEQYARFCQETV